MLAIIAPGQGSQTPGMFNSWVTNPVFHELLSQWSMRIDLDLIGLGTKADADETLKKLIEAGATGEIK